jgi:class 3 adenylate cyclase
MLLTLFFGAAFSVGFIVSGHWFDPQVPIAASGTGVIASFIWALAAKTRYNRHFRLAYGAVVSRSCLKNVMRAGKPLPSQTAKVSATVVAIKNFHTTSGEYFPDRHASSKEMISFQEKASNLVKKAGGTIIGTEGDIVTACFGSPLERVGNKKETGSGSKKKAATEIKAHTPTALALQAVDFVSHIARNPEYASWHFGLHLGNCTFAWTALSGYFALGIPVQRARLLSALTGRYQSRIIISDSFTEALPDMVGKRLGILKENDGTKGEAFYRLAESS